MGRRFLLLALLLLPLSFYPFLRGTDTLNGNHQHNPVELPPPLTPDQRLVLGCFSILPGAPFPASIPWEPFRKIGQQESRMLEQLAEQKPLEFLERCLEGYEKNLQSYRCIFAKQEKVNGKLRKAEKIRVHFRANPFSVHMDWIEGAGKAVKTLYVQGENGDLLIARALFSFGPIRHVEVDNPDAKATSRFPITQFGIHAGAKDTLASMRAAQQKDALHIKYDGIVRVKELGNRLCYKFIRTPYSPPEQEGVNELTVYIDLETMFQTGSVLKDAQGDLIAVYFFREIELNPTFDPKQFTIKAI